MRRLGAWSGVLALAGSVGLAGSLLSASPSGAATAVAVLEQDADAADVQALEQTMRELRELRRSYYAERDDLEARIRTTREQVADLRSDVDELEEDRARQGEDEQAVRAEMDALTEEHAGILERLEQTRAGLVALAEPLRAQVQAGLPYRMLDRLTQLDRLAEAPSARQAFVVLWSFCEEELRVARSGESYTDRVQLEDGREKDARFVRVGRSVLGFVTEDGVEVGLWGGDDWLVGDELPDPDAVRTAVEILDRRTGPEHVVLPVQLMPSDA